jgi:hypothetical protein
VIVIHRPHIILIMPRSNLRVQRVRTCAIRNFSKATAARDSPDLEAQDGARSIIGIRTELCHETVR